ncbi:F0F1 ATP synthase subunit gamma [Cardiobacteriaceae bacterium TAE3-ERU3]|nr:F0F1 ATP synthase subunit gamma [Cardiobacteriaceae bacterium TAE3-ERU3]
MANAKDIRGQIKSIKSTQKITKAMEMVAASKMRRAQANMQHGRPYAENILRMVSHLAGANVEGSHPFFTEREEVKKVGYIIVSTDRGLCGGLNINLFKAVLKHMRGQEEKGRKIEASVFGRKGAGFLSRIGVPVVSSVEGYGDNPKLHDLLGGVTEMVKAYREGKIDRVYLVGNVFVNTMTQQPKVLQMLPAQVGLDNDIVPNHQWEYLYEPSAEELLDTIAHRYLESLVKQTVVENIACEMSARMIAMKNASDNAGGLIDELQLKYNKARQSAITQELTEIVAGAAAV